MFLCRHLGIWVWDDHNYSCWYLVLSLLGGFSFPWFLLPFLIFGVCHCVRPLRVLGRTDKQEWGWARRVGGEMAHRTEESWLCYQYLILIGIVSKFPGRDQLSQWWVWQRDRWGRKAAGEDLLSSLGVGLGGREGGEATVGGLLQSWGLGWGIGIWKWEDRWKLLTWLPGQGDQWVSRERLPCFLRPCMVRQRIEVGFIFLVLSHT